MKHPDFIRTVRSQRGSALVMALLALLFLSVLGVSLASLGMTEYAISTNWRDYSRAFYGAEAGLEAGVANLKTVLSANPDPTAADLAAIAAPALTTTGLTYSAFAVRTVLPVAPYSYATVLPTSSAYPGLTGTATDYQVNAQVTAAAPGGGAKANLTQVYQYIKVPLFQYGIFYGKGVDLEVAPGANMTFNGRVHANSNIYMGADGGATLSFDSYITAAGSIYRRIKRDTVDIPFGSNPRIKDANGNYQALNFDHDYQPGFSGNWPESSWTAALQSTFGPGGKSSTVKDSTMGVGQITPPVPDLFYNPSNPDVIAHELIELPKPGDSAALAAAKLYSKSGLRIVDGLATNASGYPVSLPAGVITSQTFYDGREGKNVTVTQVDMGALRASGLAPANGVMYVGSTTGHPVRLVNGSQLPSQGLSVVSQNPVYVQGDYNTVNKVSAAVLADAVTVLSNNWSANNSDAKGGQPVGNRPATNTTVNAAFALGPSAESSSGSGNGQLENVIRFLENWSGKNFTYSGSLVSLWHSQEATGRWISPGTYYNPPVRTWSYDTLFNTTPPPGTPYGVIMAKGRWSQG